MSTLAAWPYPEENILAHEREHHRIAGLQDVACQMLGRQPLKQAALPCTLLAQHLHHACAISTSTTC